MARKLADEGSGSGESFEDGSDSGGTVIDRREYIRAGAALVATAAISGRTVASKDTPDPREGIPECRLLVSGSGDVSKYEFTVGGDLVPGADSAKDAASRISGCSAEGVVKEGQRRYRFSGDMRNIIVYGDADVYLEGVRIDVEPSVADESYTFRDEFPNTAADR